MSTLTESKKALIEKWRSENIDTTLLKAFAEVPREEFMPAEVRGHAYMDQPLQIGHGQTISQPSTVMNMLKLLEITPKCTVLEIGAGSGYVCALLAALGCSVTGVEIIPELAISAARVIEKLGLSEKVAIHAADAGGGWEQNAPFDRILVSAAFSEVPRHLTGQLKEGGVMVVPVGTVEQRMLVCRKKQGGDIVEEDHGVYVFVPIQGKFAEEGRDELPGLPFV